MKIIRRVLALLGALIVGFCLGQFLDIDLSLFSKGNSAVYVSTIESQLKEVSELATLEYNYTNTDTMSGENGYTIFGKNISFTNKKMVVRYSGKAKFGPDMSQAEVTMVEDELVITLPHSKLLSHEIDEDSWEILDIDNGLFNRVTPQDTVEFRQQQKEIMENALAEKDLIEEADDNAEDQIETFLKALYPDEEFAIEFR